MITILGIDPGYGTIGYGVVRFDNMKFTPVQYGAAKTAPGTPMHLRLCEIYDDICTLVDTFHPDEVAIEELFFSKNVTTGIQVAQARGVILLALAQKGLHPVSYTPNQVKLSVVGYGGAEKKQVMEMTKSILHLTKLPRPDDAADALALAIKKNGDARRLDNDTVLFVAAWVDRRVRSHPAKMDATLQAATLFLDLAQRFEAAGQAALKTEDE